MHFSKIMGCLFLKLLNRIRNLFNSTLNLMARIFSLANNNSKLLTNKLPKLANNNI